MEFIALSPISIHSWQVQTFRSTLVTTFLLFQVVSQPENTCPLGEHVPFFKILTTTSKCKTNIKQSLPQKFNIESAKYYEITKCQRQLSVPRHSSCLFSLPLSNKTPHLWNHCSGTYGGSIPFRKESSNASPLTGWEDGTMWPAPLTEANVNPPLYCCTYPPICKHKHSEVMNVMRFLILTFTRNK